MSALRVRRFTQEPRFQLSGEPPIVDAATEEDVARIWRTAAADPSRHLADNEILCVADFGNTVEVQRAPYRYYFAQTERPELFPCPLTALAVSGLLLCEDRLLLGRRAEWVLQDPGKLELVPSGSVDADLGCEVRQQLDREAAEELGVGHGALSGHRLLGAVVDDANHLIDIVIRATLGCSFAQLLDAHSRLSEPEYSELFAVTPGELQRMIADGSERISAVSSAIFAHFCAAPE